MAESEEAKRGTVERLRASSASLSRTPQQTNPKGDRFGFDCTATAKKCPQEQLELLDRINRNKEARFTYHQQEKKRI